MHVLDGIGGICIKTVNLFITCKHELELLCGTGPGKHYNIQIGIYFLFQNLIDLSLDPLFISRLAALQHHGHRVGFLSVLPGCCLLAFAAASASAGCQ